MKKALQLLGVALLLFMSNSLSAQRYLSEIFTAWDSTSDVVYGQNIAVLTGSPVLGSMKMDVYEPQGDLQATRPLIILCHTGSFLPPVINGQPTGSRKDSTIVEMAKQFAKRGYVTAVMSNRLGWNPTSSDQDTRTGTLLNAAYRGIQDLRTCVRYFRRSVAEMGNPYKVDSSFIIAGGIGTGGYITFGAAALDKSSELNLTKFTNATTGQPYVNPAINGNFYGTDSTALCRPNHVGYNSRISFAFNLGGALGDSTWMEQGEVPMVGFHCPSDPFAPYNYGAVIVPTTGDFVVNVSGTYGALRRTNAFGNNAAMIAAVASLNDPYTVRANAINNGHEGLFPFITPAPGAPLACPSGNVNQIPQGSPWDWWNEQWYIAAANAVGQPGAEVACRAKIGNPDMSPTKGRIYIDSIMQYLNPRIFGTLGFPSGIEQSFNKDVKVFPNPANTHVVISSAADDEIVGIQLFDVAGKEVFNAANLFTQSYTLNRNGLPAGIYMVKLQFKDGQGTGKVWFE